MWRSFGRWQVIQQGLNRRNYLNLHFNWAVTFELLCSLFKLFFLERPYQWQLKNGEKRWPCLRSTWHHKLRRNMWNVCFKRGPFNSRVSAWSALYKILRQILNEQGLRGKKTVSKSPWASVSSVRGFLQKVLFQIGFGYLNLYLYPVPYALKAQTVFSSPFFF